MTNYFQIKITDEARNTLDQESKNFLADMGWFEEDMSRWVVVDEMTAEDYFDVDKQEIKLGIKFWKADNCADRQGFKQIMYFDREYRDGGIDLIVEFWVREVPPLKSFSPVGGIVLSDDIVFQMSRELEMLAEEGIPPGTGSAVNWFRSVLATPFDHDKYWDEQLEESN